MAITRVRFTFPQELIKEPVIYNLVRQFNVVPNIRRADVREDSGWVILELEGGESEIDRSIEWIKEQGVRVDPVGGDIIEG